jgi:two-component system response regulator CpxR
MDAARTREHADCTVARFMSLLLVVDDEQSLREMMAYALTSEGHEVVEAENGAVALRLLKTRPLPNLVLLDLTMPVMSGFEVLAALRADPLLSSLPVVVLTSNEVPRDEVQGKAVLHKPIEERELVELVRTLCGTDVALHRAMSSPPASFLAPTPLDPASLHRR